MCTTEKCSTALVTKYLARGAPKIAGPSCLSYWKAWHCLLNSHVLHRIAGSDKPAGISSHAKGVLRILLQVFQKGLVKDWCWLCRTDLMQLYTHLPARQSPALICNLLFITKRQKRRLGKADNLVAFSSIHLHPHITIIQRALCGKTNGMIAFCCIGGGEFCILCRIWM